MLASISALAGGGGGPHHHHHGGGGWRGPVYFPGYYERQPTVVVVEPTKEAVAQGGTPATSMNYLLLGLGAAVLVLGTALVLRH